MGDENTDPHLVTIPRRQSSRQTPGAWHHSRASGSAQTILTDTTTSPISPRPKESLHRTPAWSSVNVRKTRKAEHGGSLGPMGKSSTKLRRLQIFQGHNEGRPSALKADPQPLREIPPEDNISLRGLGGHGQPWVTPSRGADLARSSTEILARLPLSSFGLSSENSRKRGSVKRRVFSKLLSFRQPKTHPSTEPMMNEGSNLGVTSRNGKEGGSVTCSDGSVTGLLNIRNDTPEDATKHTSPNTSQDLYASLKRHSYETLEAELESQTFRTEDAVSPSTGSAPFPCSVSSTKSVIRHYQTDVGPEPALTAKLEVLQTADVIDADQGRSIWVGVELHAILTHHDDLIRCGANLDVVLVIDDSLASSQQWLNMVQKLAISIAGHLNRLGDRIAVLHSACSFEQSDENDGDCDLYALDHPNVPALKKILSSPAQCRRYSNNCPNDPCEHFNSAVKKVSECLAVPPRVPSSQFQAFIFSRTPMKYWSAMRRLAPSAIHVVLPPGSPCDVPHSRPSGWNIVPTCADMASLTDACGPGCTETGSRISDIMSLARAGVTLEKITDVSICARAGDGCQEQRVVGNTSLRVLRPGQVARLFMQIRVPALEHCLHSREHHRKNPADGAFHDLETLLGDIYTDVLNVEVSFRHSLFPNKSRVVIREDARVRRPDNTSFWANSDAAALSYSNSARIGRKQAIESLASLFAESYSPGKALSDIDELLIEMDYDSSPNDSMGRLRDELDYRYRVEHKLPIPELSIHERSLHSVPSYTEVLSIDSQELLRLSPSVKSVPSVGRSGSRCTIVHNISHKSSHEGSTTRLTPDRARVIWRHMRKDSRGKSPVNVKHLRRRSKDNLKSLGGANSMMLRLKRKALLNKRSIGADSLRSMAFDIAEESRFERDYAPWML